MINPNSKDIAPSFRVWMRRFISGKTHVTYGGLVTLSIGIYENITTTLKIPSIILMIVGIAICVDEAAHLFSN